VAPVLNAGRWAAAISLATCLTACPSEEPPPKVDNPTREAPAAEATPTSPVDPGPTAAEVRARLLAWLDPEAVSVAYLRSAEPFSGEALAVVYGLPPRAENLLQATNDVDQALEAVRPSEAPAASTWLGSETLVTASRFSRRPTILRPLTRPRTEVIERLEAFGLRRQEVDVFEIWEPERVFPYRVVLLHGDVAAFIPATEPGSGLPPLIAARDMPPSDVETQLDDLLAAPGGPALALFAAGPMLHFDLDSNVLAVRFELLAHPDGSLDGQVVLQIEGDPGPAVLAMQSREAPEQSDRIRELVKRTAYVQDGDVVAGRLQLSASDAALLHLPR